MLYKIVSRILTSRLQKVVSSVVSDTQAGFIHGRVISDDILHATELVKGYNRKYNTPRCMLKIDLTKAYDSINWRFLLRVMEEIEFPNRFINWSSAYITTVSYSVVVNGKPILAFQATKGLRQRDPLSPYLFVIGILFLYTVV